jgi:hypothetical protein
LIGFGNCVLLIFVDDNFVIYWIDDVLDELDLICILSLIFWKLFIFDIILWLIRDVFYLILLLFLDLIILDVSLGIITDELILLYLLIYFGFSY